MESVADDPPVAQTIGNKVCVRDVAAPVHCSVVNLQDLAAQASDAVVEVTEGPTNGERSANEVWMSRVLGTER